MKEKNIKVSVIIPVYNVERYLAECLQSVLGQTLKEIEVICVNDGSCDGSSNILEKFSKKDMRMKIISHEKPLGASAARNKALDNAAGEYIGFVDSDDWIDRNYYEVLYSKAKETSADIVRTTYKYNSGNSEKESELNAIIKKRCSAGETLGVNEHSVVIWNAIYRKFFLRDKNIYYFDEDLLCANDIPFTARATLAGGKIVPAVGTNYHYRINVKNQLTIFSVRRIIDILKSNGKVIEVLNGYELSREDYLEAFQRCIWRYDDVFSKALDLNEADEKFQIFFAEEILCNFHKCRYIDEYKKRVKKKYVGFFADRDIAGYLKSKHKKSSALKKTINNIKDTFKKIRKYAENDRK